MKKNILLTTAVLILNILVNAQTYFTFPNQMDQTNSYVNSTIKADINSDGYIDLVVSTGYGNNIYWYKNNTDGTFEELQVDTIDNPKYVASGDVDGDGDIDIIASSTDDDYIAWYPNTDGLGTFGPPQILITDMTNPWKVILEDINGDNKKDIVAHSTTDTKVVWYENLGTGNFGSQQLIVNHDYYDFIVGDIDGDGDNDIVSAYHSGDAIYWLENTDGSGTFSAPVLVSSQADFANSVFIADVDGDLDMDILSSSSNDDKIAWYENTDGIGTFGAQQIISLHADGANYVYAADLDSDGDMDVLSTSSNDSIVAWYENLGAGVFDTSAQNILSNIFYEPRAVIAHDIDNDGDIDVFSTAYWNQDVDWYENRSLKIFTNPINTSECIANSSLFTIEAKDYDSLQWQVNTGSGFVDITNNSTYFGANNDSLIINFVDANMDGYLYRCILINNAGTLNSNQATLSVPADAVNPTLVCMTNQTRTADSSNYYTVIGSEFNPFSVSDNCNIESVVNNYNNDSTLNNATFPVGTTTVTWLATDYFGNTSTCSFDVIIDVNTNINSLNSNTICLFPNPAHNQLIISSEQLVINNIEILDITGKTIKQITINNEQLTIDISDMKNGIYFIKLQTNKTNQVVKFIKQ